MKYFIVGLLTLWASCVPFKAPTAPKDIDKALGDAQKVCAAAIEYSRFVESLCGNAKNCKKDHQEAGRIIALMCSDINKTRNAYCSVYPCDD
jgi:hypothetical protein